MPIKVLVTPLNWGLGHATRCIPIIQSLIELNAEVIIAGSGISLELLKPVFPQLTFILLKEKEITYPNNGQMGMQLIKMLPRLFFNLVSDHQQVKKIIKQHSVGLIISDNRFGCWNKKCYSVFITHQITIQSPVQLKWIQPFINSINHFFIRRYNECWIPDVKELPGLSGILSHRDYYLPSFHFINPLSRFADCVIKVSEKKYELVAILSGPEPQRSIFEKLILSEVQKLKMDALIIRGTSHSAILPTVSSSIKILNQLETSELKFHLLNAKYIVCRSGYSSMMDLACIGRSAIIIPTPGQTEQEYLASFFHLQKKHFMQLQSQFDLTNAIKGVNKCVNPALDCNNSLLKENVLRVIQFS